jgi:hypothetical protein
MTFFFIKPDFSIAEMCRRPKKNIWTKKKKRRMGIPGPGAT